MQQIIFISQLYKFEVYYIVWYTINCIKVSRIQIYSFGKVRISIENKYTLKCAIAIDQLFTLAWITSINQFPCKYFFQLNIFLYKIRQIWPTIRISLSDPVPNILHQFQHPVCLHFLISVKNMNLLSSSIYKHLKIKYK